MIQLFLNFGEHANESELDLIYDQTYFNKLMLLVILITPPWILFAKPLILKQQHEALTQKKIDNGGDFELKKVSPTKNR